MKASVSLLSAAVIGSTMLGFVNPAAAANIVQRYRAFDYGPSHSFWFHGLSKAGYSTGSYYVFDAPGELIEYDDGTATLTGSIVNKRNADQRWDVDLTFNLVDDWQGGLKGAHYAPGGSSYARDNWNFYQVDYDNSILTGQGDYEGSVLQVFNRAFSEENYQSFVDSGKDPHVVGQLGIGANDKNGDLGFSFWYGYTGNFNFQDAVTPTTTYTELSPKSQTISDINLRLEKVEVPEPSALVPLIGLALVGSGTVLKRRRQSV